MNCSVSQQGSCINLIYIKKVCADLPYSQTGLAQPITSYAEAYAQWRNAPTMLYFALKFPLFRGGSSSWN